MKTKLIVLFTLMITQVMQAQEVEIIGSLKIDNGSQGDGKVLMSDENGVANWVSSNTLLIEMHKNLEGGLVSLINWGIQPTELIDNGVAYDSIIGLDVYSGIGNGIFEYIFYIDTLDVYSWNYLTAGKTGFIYNNWACQTTAVSGADSANFGDGEQNTNDVITNCPSPPDPASAFTQQLTNSGPNTHIASSEEALLIYDLLIEPGIYEPWNGQNNFWTSTEASGANEATRSMAISKVNGSLFEVVKTTQMPAMVVERHY